MSILKIAKIGHPVLFKEADTVNSISKAEIKKLVMDMSETLLDANGIGLAAPQVYVSKKIIIFRLDEESQINNKVKIRVLVNPSFKNKGMHSIIWNPINISSGIYFINILSDNNIKAQKLMYMK